MFVVSLKLDKNRIYATLATLCLVVAVACVAFPERSRDVLNNNIDTNVKSTAEHIEFLNSYGYNVIENPVQIQEIVIPSQFSESYEKYNEYQIYSPLSIKQSARRHLKRRPKRNTDFFGR